MTKSRFDVHFVYKCVGLTQDPWQDHPLHSSGCRSLPILLRGDNVLGCQKQQEEEGQVGGRVANELDERFADEEAVATLGHREVAESEQRVEEADEDAGEELSCPVASPPAGELVVPAGCQKLLTVGLRNKLGEEGIKKFGVILHIR